MYVCAHVSALLCRCSRLAGWVHTTCDWVALPAFWQGHGSQVGVWLCCAAVNLCSKRRQANVCTADAFTLLNVHIARVRGGTEAEGGPALGAPFYFRTLLFVKAVNAEKQQVGACQENYTESKTHKYTQGLGTRMQVVPVPFAGLPGVCSVRSTAGVCCSSACGSPCTTRSCRLPPC